MLVCSLGLPQMQVDIEAGYARKILILGVSSWLGYELVASLARVGHIGAIIGTYHQTAINFPGYVNTIQTRSSSDILHLLEQFQPDVVVNFLRGETESDFALHCQLHQRLRKMQRHYVYASSVLALDGYQDTPLTEILRAKAVSDYGKFKARCEHVFDAADPNWCVLRFASVQGWVPHRRSRNEVFLAKLAQGQSIEVDQGVQQNRMLASLVTDGIAKILSHSLSGIIHFGTVDASDELIFLRKVASSFGHNPALVIAGKERAVNLVAQPERIHRELGPHYYVTEQDTLDGLTHLEGLRKYYFKGLQKNDAKNS